MTAASIYLNTITRKGITLIVAGATMVMVLIFSLSVNFTPASAGAIVAAPLCGNGTAPEYGFNYDLQQAHWTVGWQDYVSDKTVAETEAPDANGCVTYKGCAAGFPVVWCQTTLNHSQPRFAPQATWAFFAQF